MIFVLFYSSARQTLQLFFDSPGTQILNVAVDLHQVCFLQRKFGNVLVICVLIKQWLYLSMRFTPWNLSSSLCFWHFHLNFIPGQTLQEYCPPSIIIFWQILIHRVKALNQLRIEKRRSRQSTASRYRIKSKWFAVVDDLLPWKIVVKSSDQLLGVPETVKKFGGA